MTQMDEEKPDPVADVAPENPVAEATTDGPEPVQPDAPEPGNPAIEQPSDPVDIPVIDEHAGQRLVVIKHHALVRLSHWLNVPILFALIVSGLSIYWASPVFLHKPDPVTHSRDYLADLGILIARRIPGALANPAWFYKH